jgi:hypothetical protein
MLILMAMAMTTKTWTITAKKGRMNQKKNGVGSKEAAEARAGEICSEAIWSAGEEREQAAMAKNQRERDRNGFSESSSDYVRIQ